MLKPTGLEMEMLGMESCLLQKSWTTWKFFRRGMLHTAVMTELTVTVETSGAGAAATRGSARSQKERMSALQKFAGQAGGLYTKRGEEKTSKVQS